MKRNPKPTPLSPGQGFGLIELMVALAVGLLIALAIGEIYLAMRRGQQTTDHLGELQEGARFISEQLKRDVRMAGYFGGTYQKWNSKESTVAAFQAPAISKECFLASTAGVSFRWAVPITTVGSGDGPPKVYGSDTLAPFTNCVSGTLSTASDILSVHYAGPRALAISELKGPGYFLQTSITGIFGFFCPSGSSGSACLPPDIPAAAAGTEYYPLVSRLYYVRTWARKDGDGIPTLMVTELSGAAISTQPLVEGVAVFQLLYGFDSNGDGEVDNYQSATELGDLSATNIANWNRVKTVEAWFVLRSVDQDASRLNSQDKVYAIGANNFTVDGRYMSRLYKITAALRNPGDRAGGV